MSNTESFIDEVTEEVRRDRLYGLFRRYGWIGAVVVLGIVGGAAFNEFTKARTEAAAQATGDAIIAALENDDLAAGAEALAALRADTSGNAAAVVAFLEANQQVDAGNADAARTALQSVAGLSDADPIYREIAQLKLLMLQAGDGAPEARIEQLRMLAQPGAPLRLLAEEQIALAQIEAGNDGAAIDGLQTILQDAEATRGLRDRAQSLIVALGGTPGGDTATAAD